MDLQASVFQNQTEISVVDNVIPLCELARGLEEADPSAFLEWPTSAPRDRRPK
jgi:hypothetical protein